MVAEKKVCQNRPQHQLMDEKENKIVILKVGP
jgi:hypothetical protein